MLSVHREAEAATRLSPDLDSVLKHIVNHTECVHFPPDVHRNRLDVRLDMEVCHLLEKKMLTVSAFWAQ